MDDPLQKFIVLVPLFYNDGRPVPNELILDFQEELFVVGGGFTIAGTVEGAYRMSDGKKQIDHTVEYWIGVPSQQVARLRAIVAKLGQELGQESMYLEHTGSTIEFVPPSAEGRMK